MNDVVMEFPSNVWAATEKVGRHPVEKWIALAALVVAVVAIPIAVLATRRWGTRRARVEVYVIAAPLLLEQGAGLLKVTYREVDVDNPHLVTVVLRNIGPRDVTTATFDAGQSIAVRFDRTFYGVTSTEGGVELESPAVGASGDQAVIRIKPALLKREHAWSFSALSAGPVEIDVDAPLIDTDVRHSTPFDEPSYMTVVDVAVEVLRGIGVPGSRAIGWLSDELRSRKSARHSPRH